MLGISWAKGSAHSASCSFSTTCLSHTSSYKSHERLIDSVDLFPEVYNSLLPSTDSVTFRWHFPFPMPVSYKLTHVSARFRAGVVSVSVFERLLAHFVCYSNLNNNNVFFFLGANKRLKTGRISYIFHLSSVMCSYYQFRACTVPVSDCSADPVPNVFLV